MNIVPFDQYIEDRERDVINSVFNDGVLEYSDDAWEELWCSIDNEEALTDVFSRFNVKNAAEVSKKYFFDYWKERKEYMDCVE